MNKTESNVVINALKSKVIFAKGDIEIQYNYSDNSYSVETKDPSGQKATARKKYSESDMIKYLEQQELSHYSDIL